MPPLFGSGVRARGVRPWMFLAVPLLAFLFWFPTQVHAQSEALTLPSNLTRLVDESQLIVQARVAGVSVEPHGQLRNLMTVVVTLQVEETVKGAPVSTYTFRLAAIDPRDVAQRMGYRVGQHVLLALIAPSPYGLSSTAGLQQGRFQITAGAGGKPVATNGYANAGLFNGVETQLRSSGAKLSPEAKTLMSKPAGEGVPLEDLKSLMRTIAARGGAQ